MFIVDRQYRVNPLSLKPGGYTVGILREDGKKLYYPNVKNSKMFIEAAIKNGAVQGWVAKRSDERNDE
jgi:hypothetical protein